MSWARQERFALPMKFFFSQTNTPGRSSSDELGEAREARPFRKRSRGSGGAARPPRKIAEPTENIFNEILIFSQRNTPRRCSYDELGEAREARPFRKRSRAGPVGRAAVLPEKGSSHACFFLFELFVKVGIP